MWRVQFILKIFHDGAILVKSGVSFYNFRFDVNNGDCCHKINTKWHWDRHSIMLEVKDITKWSLFEKTDKQRISFVFYIDKDTIHKTDKDSMYIGHQLD